MFDYEDIADRFWNLPQKGLEEKNREVAGLGKDNLVAVGRKS